MAGQEVMSSGEIVWAMLILLVVLCVVTFFFCCLPVYKALQARFTYWEDPENDPRWNSDQFQFSPTSPSVTNKVDRNKYNRLSTGSMTGQSVSRASSFRNQSVFPRFDDQFEIKLPPAYSDIYDPGSGGDLSSLGSPPEYYSHSPSDTEDNERTTGPPAEIPVCSESVLVEKPARVLKKLPPGGDKIALASEWPQQGGERPKMGSSEGSKVGRDRLAPSAEEPGVDGETGVDAKEISTTGVKAAETKLTATEALRKARAEAAKAKRAQKQQSEETTTVKNAKPPTDVSIASAAASKSAAAPGGSVPGLARPNRRGELASCQSQAVSAVPPADSAVPTVVQPPRKVHKKAQKSPN